MKKYNFVASCHFGIEAVLKREIQDLGYDIVKVEEKAGVKEKTKIKNFLKK